jgi:hypothetical protein
MVLVAATAVAFAIFRYSVPSNIGLNTFGTPWEPQVFYWMHRLTPFPAMWSLAVTVIARSNQRGAQQRGSRHAGVIACYAATGAVAIAVLIASGFYAAHILEDQRNIPRIFSHPTQSHPLPPFGSATLEEIGGAAVLGAWSALAAGCRWRTEPTWIDRLGRVLGSIWIGLLVVYLYGYTG